MVQVIWSPEAKGDLNESCEYIARTSSESQAGSFAARVLAVVESIGLLPYSGWVVSEYGEVAIRERLSGKHRIIYRVDGDTVRVLTIIRGAKKLPKRFD